MKNNYKGIVLAGGSATRLRPITNAISKQIIPVYDKPMIYYSLSVLMLAGIREILIITTKYDLANFYNLLGDGSNFGISLKYKIQEKPNGIAESFIIGSDFIRNSNVALILGDNFFFGNNFTLLLKKAVEKKSGSSIFLYKTTDPKRFGIAEIDKNNKIKSFVEKPKKPKSNLAVTGLYFYDNNVIEMAKKLKPSGRNELEITDINKMYLKKNKINFFILNRGFNWMDMGTPNSLFDASNFIKTFQDKSGHIIGCLEEIAFNYGWIKKKQLLKICEYYKQSEYGKYLRKLI